MRDDDIESRLHSALNELTRSAPLANPERPPASISAHRRPISGGATTMASGRHGDEDSSSSDSPKRFDAKLLLAVACALLLVGGLTWFGLSRPSKDHHSNVVSTSTTTVPTTTPATTSTTPSPSSTTTTTPAVTTAPCTAVAVAAGADAADPGAVITQYGCAGGFAYAFETVPAPAPLGGVGATALFKSVAGAWSYVDRSTYCPEVPASIYRDACETN